MTGAFADIQQRLASRLDHLQALATRAQNHHLSVRRDLAVLRTKLEAGESYTVAAEDLAAIFDRVHALADAGRVDDVTRRDAKAVVLSADHPRGRLPVVIQLLDRSPRLWGVLARAYFGRWDELKASGQLSTWSKLLEKMPRPPDLAGRVKGGWPSLLAADADAHVATVALPPSAEWRLVIEELRRLGWPLRSGFALSVMCAWLGKQQGSRDAGARIAEVMAHPELGPLLFPLGQKPPAPGSDAPTHSRVAFLALLIDAGISSWSSEAVSAFLHAETLLLDRLGDPRWTSHLLWTALQRAHPESYARLLEHLSTEDLEFFFDHLQEKDARRLKFWREYLGHCARTITVLSQNDHAAIRAHVTALSPEPENDRIRNSFKRVRVFHRKSANMPSTFCLYMGDVVAVEFSLTGNAAYFYKKDVFARHFEDMAKRGSIGGAAELKSPELADERLSHTSDWERSFADVLRHRYSLLPKRTSLLSLRMPSAPVQAPATRPQAPQAPQRFSPPPPASAPASRPPDPPPSQETRSLRSMTAQELDEIADENWSRIDTLRSISSELDLRTTRLAATVQEKVQRRMRELAAGPNTTSTRRSASFFATTGTTTLADLVTKYWHSRSVLEDIRQELESRSSDAANELRMRVIKRLRDFAGDQRAPPPPGVQSSSVAPAGAAARQSPIRDAGGTAGPTGGPDSLRPLSDRDLERLMHVHWEEQVELDRILEEAQRRNSTRAHVLLVQLQERLRQWRK